MNDTRTARDAFVMACNAQELDERTCASTVETIFVGQSEGASETAGAGELAKAANRVSVARQGHLYYYKGIAVIALESGDIVLLLRASDSTVSKFRVDAAALIPMPMRYYHGEIPA